MVVLDDHSDDGTADVVRGLAARDPRVRLATGPPLPPGWCGKQHACALLGREARHSLLLFLDADVRLTPSGLSQMVAFQRSSNADLVSGIPFQETGTWLERLLIPLIHFILLGFLPLGKMRASRDPAFAAGCGQLFLARRAGYEQVGGHAAVRTSLHDGLTLPRAFRQAGLATDLCDATGVASCRMYRSAREVWFGLAKNATEGLASPRLIGPATLLLLGGQVLPLVLLAVAGATVGRRRGGAGGAGNDPLVLSPGYRYQSLPSALGVGFVPPCRRDVAGDFAVVQPVSQPSGPSGDVEGTILSRAGQSLDRMTC